MSCWVRECAHRLYRDAQKRGRRETPEALSRRNCELMPERLTGDAYDPTKAYPDAYERVNNFR